MSAASNDLITFKVGLIRGIIKTKNAKLNKIQIVFGCKHIDYDKDQLRLIDPKVDLIWESEDHLEQYYSFTVKPVHMQIKYPWPELRGCYYQPQLEGQYLQDGKLHDYIIWPYVGAGTWAYVPSSEELAEKINDPKLTEKIQKTVFPLEECGMWPCPKDQGSK